MTTLRFVTFIYGIYLYSTAYTGAVPIISINKQNILNRFNDGLLQQQQQQQKQQQQNKYMNIRGGNSLLRHKQEGQGKQQGDVDELKDVPTYMLDLYKIVSKQTDSDLLHHGNTIRSYFDSESSEHELNLHRYKFQINDIKSDKEDLKKAELRVFKLANVHRRAQNAYVQINIINRYNGQVVSSKLMGTKAHGWMTFPLTDIVRTWISNPEFNQGIRIAIKTIYGDGKDSVDFATRNHVRREPILVIFTKRQNEGLESIIELGDAEAKLKKKVDSAEHLLKRRRKRNTELTMDDNSRSIEDTTPTCRLKRLDVPVDVIAAKVQIIIPKVLKINQCVGTCETSNLNTNENEIVTNHAYIQGLYAIGNKDVKLPCCAPSSFDPQTTLQREFVNDLEILKVSVLQNMIATSCSCL